MGVSEILSTIRRLPEILDLRGRDTADAGALPLRRRLARGAFWAVTGTGVSRVLALLASIAVARVLGKTGFGEFGMVQSTIGLFGTFAGFGMGATATKHVAEHRTTDKAKAGRIMALSGVTAAVTGLLMAAGLFLAAPFLAEKTLAAPRLAPLLRIGSLYLFFSAVNGAQTGALTGFEAFRTIAKLNLAIGLSYFPLVVGGVWLGGLEGAVWGLTLSMVLGWTVTHFALRKKAAAAGVPFEFRGCMKEWGVLWRFSFPSVINNAMLGPAMWVCNALLVNRPGGYGELGLLNAAMKWYAIVIFVPSQFGNAVFPVLAWEKSGESPEGGHSVLGKAVKATFLLTLAAALPIALFSPLIMRAYGKDFQAGSLLLVLLCAAALFRTTGGVFILELASRNKMWSVVLTTSIWSLVLIGFTGAAIEHGAMAITQGMLAAFAVQLVALWWMLRTSHGRKPE